MKLREERLVARRKKLRLTKKAIATKVGVSPQAYAYLEAGERDASYPVALLVSLALQTSVGYLTGDTDDPSPDQLLLKIDEADDISDMIAEYRRLPPDDKRLIRTLIEKLKR